MSAQDLTWILDRVASGEDSAAVRADLRRVARVRGDGNVVQLGNHNIALHGARDIHIDNRVYRGAEAEAIRHALEDALGGTGSLRGVAGAISTLGVLVALVGMGMFFTGLIGLMSGAIDPWGGPPPVLLTGFAVAAVGVGIGIVGGLVRGWQRPRR